MVIDKLFFTAAQQLTAASVLKGIRLWNADKRILELIIMIILVSKFLPKSPKP